MNSEDIRTRVERYYTAKLVTHGPTARGVDWNSADSQELRFAQLARLFDRKRCFSVNDYGCGYGALVDYLKANDYEFRYCGFDISSEMIASARAAHTSSSDVSFVDRSADLPAADYTIASGILNVRLDTAIDQWEQYVLETLDSIDRLSEKGFAFNALTKYSDPEFMRDTLYYADPSWLFDYCKRKFSRFVALLHDYPLYEFTLIVRKI